MLRIWQMIPSSPLSINHILTYFSFHRTILEQMTCDFALRSVRVSAELFSDAIGVLYFPKRKRISKCSNKLLLTSATDLVQLIKSGEVKCTELVEAYIARIREINPFINAMVNVDKNACFDEALQRARELDSMIETALNHSNSPQDILDLPLLGIPFTIKESISVKGQPSTGGMWSRKDIIMNRDANSVEILRNSGAIILGCTNVPEFLLYWDSYNPVYGQTNNPYDLSRISGGSSGGEGSLISSAGSLCGLGSDIGGSIRIPSFMCGIFGHKPTSCVVDADGQFPGPGHVDREKFLSFGPLCRYAEDLKLILKQLILPKYIPVMRLDDPVDLSQCQFFFLTDDGDPLKSKVSDSIISAINTAKDYFLSEGFHCQDLRLEAMRHSFFIWMAHLSDVDAPTLAEEIKLREGQMGWSEIFRGVTIGHSHHRRITCLNVALEKMFYSQTVRQKPAFRKLVEKGNSLRNDLEKLLGSSGVLILPSSPNIAPKHNGTILRANNCGWTAIFNILEMPVTQVPMGLSKKERLPVGFQVVSNRFNDRLTLAVAEKLSKKFGGWMPPF